MDDELERLKQLDQADLACYFGELRERNEREMAELQKDMQRRKSALAAEPNIRYSAPTYTPEPKLDSLTDAEIVAVRRAASVNWSGEIAHAIADERALMQEVVAQFVVEYLKDEREQIQREFNAKMLELRADLTTRMLETVTTLRKVVGDTIDLPPWPKRDDPKSVN
jgi:hypothetical protein